MSTKALLCYYAVAYVLIFTAAHFVANPQCLVAKRGFKERVRYGLLNVDQY